MNEAQLASVFSVFLASEEFVRGVILSTRASFAGDSYSVELFDHAAAGWWRILPTQEIGNQYESMGILFTLPALSEQEYAVLQIVSPDDTLDSLARSLYFSDELEECKRVMQDKYEDAYRQRMASIEKRDTDESKIK